MTYKIIDGANTIRVNITGLSQSQEEALTHQLRPFIVETDELPTHIITVERRDNDINYLIDEDHLYIGYNSEGYLFKIARQAIRDALYQKYLDEDFIKVHASAIQKDGVASMFMGQKRAGKTSLALGMCKYCDYSFMNGDLTLLRGNEVLGWSTAIGTRNKTSELLGLDYDKDKPFEWKSPADFMNMGYSMAFSGELGTIIVPRFDFDVEKPICRVLGIDDKKQYLVDNIHYDEINKNDYWGFEPVDIGTLPGKLLGDKRLLDVKMVNFICNGLSEENTQVLERIIRR